MACICIVKRSILGHRGTTQTFQRHVHFFRMTDTLFRVVFSLLLSLFGAASAASAWKLNRLNPTEYPLATCLDGSEGVYYVRDGTERSKVFVTLQGGGWCDMTTPAGLEGCSMVQNCRDRSKGTFGSTKNDNDSTMDWVTTGYFSTDPKVNPAFHNWTQVYLRYCDGASFSGLRTEAFGTSTTPLYFRGNYILLAVLDDLQKDGNALSTASHVVFSGDSAGGLATYLHTHQVREALPDSVPVVALPDSGFFLEWWETKPQNCTMFYPEVMKNVFEIANATGSLPKECLAEHEQDLHECMFAANVAQYMLVPTLMLQPRFDDWQVNNTLGYIRGKAGPITNDHVNKFGSRQTNEVLAALHAQGGSRMGSGVFLDSCLHHTAVSRSEAVGDHLWSGIFIDRISMGEATKEWLDAVLLNNGNSHVPELVSSDPFICAECCPPGINPCPYGPAPRPATVSS